MNDREELDRSIADLAGYIPCLESVSVVPVGISRYREGLYPLEPFNGKDAAEVIDQIEGWQEKLFEEHGIHFVHASDEWYLIAGRPVPAADRYDGYLQLENGVGMVRLLTDEVEEGLKELEGDQRSGELSIATGMLIYPVIRELTERAGRYYPNISIRVYPVVNRFFGESITVSGLLTGKDILEQLRERSLEAGSFFRQTF